MEEFNHVVEELGLMDDDGFSCYMKQHLNDSSDDHDGRDHDDSHDHDDDHDDSMTHDQYQHFNDSSDDDHYDDYDYNDYNHDHDYEDADDHNNATNCSTIYEVCHHLILEIGLTSKACLAGNKSSSMVNEASHNDISDSEG